MITCPAAANEATVGLAPLHIVVEGVAREAMSRITREREREREREIGQKLNWGPELEYLGQEPNSPKQWENTQIYS
ncbi:MAG: hypothetical protein KTM48_04200, partial [Wolbachia endosymbiont of Pissodes strobi]|nr:hypothetical protein [Wolbachia endosymbiont of Pissodes strobi]